jgi:predicted RNA binding protein YcfA (HicA-like mRNA interferase family)
VSAKPRSSLPKTLSQASALKLLEANGWVRTLGGKHVVKMEKPGERPTTLPMHKGGDYSPNLRAAILKQAGLPVDNQGSQADEQL